MRSILTPVDTLPIMYSVSKNVLLKKGWDWIWMTYSLYWQILARFAHVMDVIRKERACGGRTVRYNVLSVRFHRIR